MLCAALALALLWAVFDRALGRPLLLAACEKARERTLIELNSAASRAIGEAGELVPGLVNSREGETLVINADAAGLDLLTSSAVSEAQERMARLSESALELPLGTVLGPAWLSGCGPDLRAGFMSMGAVEAGVRSRLTCAGINQTLFTIELRLTARLRVFAAGRTEELTCEAELPVCTTVIVGAVPQVYTNIANEEDMLNLVPTELP